MDYMKYIFQKFGCLIFFLIFRDLGSSLRSLHVLWASRCSLSELDGISSMCNLKELYLSYNEICDISALSMLDQIEIIDLEGYVSIFVLFGSFTFLEIKESPWCKASVCSAKLKLLIQKCHLYSISRVSVPGLAQE